MADLSGIWAAKESSGAPPPGNYHAEVMHAELKRAQTGRLGFSLRFKIVDTERTLCFDNLWLEGEPAALGMTKTKLKALGIPEGTNPDAEELRGKRVYLAVKEKDDGYLEVNIRAKGSKVGYWSESNPPTDVLSSDPPGPGGVPNNLDTPFI